MARTVRVATWNVNGLRAAIRKGIGDWLDPLGADVLLLQEVRAHPEQLPGGWAEPEGWDVCWHPAERGGYSGVAVWSRTPVEVLETGLGGPDPEGRVLTVRTAGLRLASVYAPSGSSSEDRQAVKDAWMPAFRAWSARHLRARTPTLLAGDLNVAPTERDLYHWKSNRKTSGFLPHERRWFADLLADGWHDPVRAEAGDVDGPYSWWSNRGRARELDRGWRIDHVLANGAARKRITGCGIHREAGLAISDHAPVWVDVRTG